MQLGPITVCSNLIDNLHEKWKRQLHVWCQDKTTFRIKLVAAEIERRSFGTIIGHLQAASWRWRSEYQAETCSDHVCDSKITCAITNRVFDIPYSLFVYEKDKVSL